MTATPDLEQAIEVLNNDGIIITVTDTIPGLSCLANSANAIQKIIEIKQRPDDKGLILTAGQLPLLEGYCQSMSAPQRERIETTAEPTTWLVKARVSINKHLTGSYDTIAIRLSNHPLIAALTEALQQPLVTTSANLHAQASVSELDQISNQVVDQVDLVLDGPAGTGSASVIIRLDNNQTIRT